jgi:hypothetical protein
MPWLDHGIHSVTVEKAMSVLEWMPGSSPGMTTNVGGMKKGRSDGPPSRLKQLE